MKNTSILILLLVFAFSCGKKDVKKENTKFTEPPVEFPVTKVDEVKNEAIPKDSSKLIFTVQIAALKNENKDLMSIDGIKTYQENSLTKYRLGRFASYNEARKFRKQIISNYKGAFVQAIKSDTPIHISEALQD